MSRFLLIDDIRDFNYYIDQYDGEIRYVDYHIGELLEWLREHGLMDNSIIIITSDHGEGFFEHGWCGHGMTLYDEEIRVPLIVRLPGSSEVKGVEKMRVQLVDIVPTISSLLKCRFPCRLEGRSFIDVDQTGDIPIGGEPVFSELHKWQPWWKAIPPKVAMIEGDYKYVYYIPEGKVLEMYDIRKDDGEAENLVPEHEEKVAEVTERIAAWLKERRRGAIGIRMQQEAPALEKDDTDTLRALGYL